MVLFIFSVFILNSNAQEQDEDVIDIDSSIVILNAVVTTKTGNTVFGLKLEDFLLLEDGVKQDIDFADSEKTPFATAILLDVSGSMLHRISLARSAAIQFLQGIRPQDNVAIYSFDTKVKLVQDFSNSRDLRSAFFDLKADGNTALYDAVYEAADALSKRPEKRRAIVVLSDGADTRSGRSAKNALKAAQAANATIYTVDMSDEKSNYQERRLNQSVLKNFSEETGGIFVKTPGGFELRDAFQKIVEELGLLYTIGYHSKNETKDGKFRKIKLTTNVKEAETRTREGYYAVRD